MALLVKAAVRTDAGRQRGNNEDNFYLDGTYLEKEEMDAGGAFAVDALSACALFAVCDGMGGEEKGEEASLAAVRALDGLRDALEQGGVEDVRALIDAHCERANDAVYALDGGGRAGTTFVGLCFYDDEAYCANLGDSRLYVLRDGALTRISGDHTEAACLVEGGVLTEAEAEKSVYSHVVTRYLGMPPADEPFRAAHYMDFVLHFGDRFLLCSDGLTDMLSDAEIEDILRQGATVNETVGLLVDAALEHGGKDNVTALVAEVEREQGADAPQESAEAEQTAQPRLLFDDDSTTLTVDGWPSGAAQDADSVNAEEDGMEQPAGADLEIRVGEYGAPSDSRASRDGERYLESALSEQPFTIVDRLDTDDQSAFTLEETREPLTVRDSRPAQKKKARKKRRASASETE